MEILELLRSKNQCLKRLIEISQSYLDNLETAETERLERFQARRRAMFKGLSSFDEQITRRAAALSLPMSVEEREKLRSEHCLTKEMAKTLMELDLVLARRIEEHARDVSGNIISLRKEKNAVSRFKSEQNLKSGLELDKNL